jgi:TolB protein
LPCQGSSPDGRIVFQSDCDDNYEIYVMNANGSGQTRLTKSPGADEVPRWSPDGERIVFARRG